jgi:cell division septum initiation protein DivIVA
MADKSKFTIVRRGYDQGEVDAYLRSFSQEWETRIEDTDARVLELERALLEAEEREETLRMTLLTATQTKEQVLASAGIELGGLAAAEGQAAKILNEAKFEAFKLVTDANEEADRVLSQAKTEAATTTAAATPGSAAEREIEAARNEALAMVTEVQAEMERLVAEREREMDRMRTQFEAEKAAALAEVEQLRAEATRLRNDLDSDATTVVLPGASLTSQDDAPPAPQTDLAADAAPTPAPKRGSFYSRRSARLPRIGSDAAGGALAAVAAMRARAKDVVDATEGALDHTELAMQTA